MKKILFTIIIALTILSAVYAEKTEVRYNPFTGRQDYVVTYNSSDFASANITDTNETSRVNALVTWNQTAQDRIDTLNSTKIASGDSAGGDLTGTYPNPSIANGAIGTPQLATGAVTDTIINYTNVTLSDFTNDADYIQNDTSARLSRLNLSAAGDVYQYFYDSANAVLWSFLLGNSGAFFDFIDPQGTVLLRLDSNSDEVEASNIVAGASYSGAFPFRAQNSGDSDVFTIDNSGNTTISGKLTVETLAELNNVTINGNSTLSCGQKINGAWQVCNVSELVSVTAASSAGDTIIVNEGDYALIATLDIQTDNLTFFNYGRWYWDSGAIPTVFTDLQGSNHTTLMEAQGVYGLKFFNYGEMSPKLLNDLSFSEKILFWNNSEKVEVRLGTLGKTDSGWLFYNGRGVTVRDGYHDDGATSSFVTMECIDDFLIENVEAYNSFDELVDLNAHVSNGIIRNVRGNASDNIGTSLVELNAARHVKLEGIHAKNTWKLFGTSGTAGERFGICDEFTTNNITGWGSCENCDHSNVWSGTENYHFVMDNKNSTGIVVEGDQTVRYEVTINASTLHADFLESPVTRGFNTWDIAIFLSFDDNNGTHTNDWSGYERDFTVTNAVVAEGVLGKQYDFDGSGDILSIDIPEFNENVSYSFIMQPDAVTTGHRIFSHGGNLAGNFLVDFTSNDEMRFLRFNGSGTSSNTFTTSGANFAISNTYYVTIAYDSSTNDAEIYVNGEPQTIVNGAVSASSTGTDFKIGEYQTGYFNGRIDEFIVHNATLSAQDAEALYYNQLNRRQVNPARR